ncbi:hypothetical protein Tco_1483342 [Tanacetum coccineum]
MSSQERRRSVYWTILPAEVNKRRHPQLRINKEYYAIDFRKIPHPPKTKESKNKADSDATTKQKRPTVLEEKKGKKSGKGKQKAKGGSPMHLNYDSDMNHPGSQVKDDQDEEKMREDREYDEDSDNELKRGGFKGEKMSHAVAATFRNIAEKDLNKQDGSYNLSQSDIQKEALQDDDQEPSAGTDRVQKKKSVPADHESVQPWLSNLARRQDPRESFDELTDTTFDFSAFVMNRLNVTTLTPELLAGPTFELMKGTCKSLTELEYFCEEVYKATTEKLDWINPEGRQYPHDLRKPLPLVLNSQAAKYSDFVSYKPNGADYGHIKWIEDLVPNSMWSQVIVNYDKFALWGISHWGKKRRQFYAFASTRESARDVYSKRRIIAVTKFKEGDFHRLWIQDIENMLLLLVQGKLTNLNVEERLAFIIDALHTMTPIPEDFIYETKTRRTIDCALRTTQVLSEVTSIEEPVANEPTTLVSNDNADESVQEDVAVFDRNVFYNLFHTLVFKEAESSSTFQDPSNMYESRLHTNVEMCMYALTVSTTELTNIKEAMLDHSWIKSMQDELNQFKRLDVWELVARLVDSNIIKARPTEKHRKEVKRIFRYLKHFINMGLWCSKDSGFELIAYSDADHAWCHDDCKSTSGGIQFLVDKLVRWSSKKHDCTAMSTAKAEYVPLYAYCAQVIWMRTKLLDYGYRYTKIPMYCNSKSAIAISCNLVQHSRTKHINVRYHFIKEHVEQGTIELYFVGTEYQLADLFTKALPKERFEYLVNRIVDDILDDLLKREWEKQQCVNHNWQVNVSSLGHLRSMESGKLP